MRLAAHDQSFHRRPIPGRLLMPLVQAARFDDRMAAEIARGRLASEGVPAILFDDGLASLGIGSLTPVRLMVEERDLELAQTLLAGE